MTLQALAGFLLLISALLITTSFLQMLFLAFSSSILWGLALLFLPPSWILFTILHWADTRGPVTRWAVAIALAVFASLIGR